MVKVKKAGSVRRAKSKKRASVRNAPSGARKSAGQKSAGGKNRHEVAKAKNTVPAPKFRVTPLDPQKKCGTGTSVQQLFRISEDTPDGIMRSHLVFLDRHGWYCEHGRDCPAVQHAKKLKKFR